MYVPHREGVVHNTMIGEHNVRTSQGGGGTQDYDRRTQCTYLTESSLKLTHQPRRCSQHEVTCNTREYIASLVHNKMHATLSGLRLKRLLHSICA